MRSWPKWGRGHPLWSASPRAGPRPRQRRIPPSRPAAPCAAHERPGPVFRPALRDEAHRWAIGHPPRQARQTPWRTRWTKSPASALRQARAAGAFRQRQGGQPRGPCRSGRRDGIISEQLAQRSSITSRRADRTACRPRLPCCPGPGRILRHEPREGERHELSGHWSFFRWPGPPNTGDGLPPAPAWSFPPSGTPTGKTHTEELFVASSFRSGAWRRPARPCMVRNTPHDNPDFVIGSATISTALWAPMSPARLTDAPLILADLFILGQ